MKLLAIGFRRLLPDTHRPRPRGASPPRAMDSLRAATWRSSSPVSARSSAAPSHGSSPSIPCRTRRRHGRSPGVGLTILKDFTPSGDDAWEGQIYNRENGRPTARDAPARCRPLEIRPNKKTNKTPPRTSASGSSARPDLRGCTEPAVSPHRGRRSARARRRRADHRLAVAVPTCPSSSAPPSDTNDGSARASLRSGSRRASHRRASAGSAAACFGLRPKRVGTRTALLTLFRLPDGRPRLFEQAERAVRRQAWSPAGVGGRVGDWRHRGFPRDGVSLGAYGPLCRTPCYGFHSDPRRHRAPPRHVRELLVCYAVAPASRCSP